METCLKHVGLVGRWVMMADMKVCPFCAEEIKAAAKKCRYCGEWMPGWTREVILDVLSVGDIIKIGDINEVRGASIGLRAMGINAGDVTGPLIQSQGSVMVGTSGKDHEILSNAYDIAQKLLIYIHPVFIAPDDPEDVKRNQEKFIKWFDEWMDFTPALMRIMGTKWVGRNIQVWKQFGNYYSKVGLYCAENGIANLNDEETKKVFQGFEGNMRNELEEIVGGLRNKMEVLL